MKTVRFFVLALTVLVLQACSVLGYLTPRQFDPVEYGKAVSVVIDATRLAHNCSTPTDPLYTRFVNELNTDSMYLEEYVAHKKDNEDATTGSAQIRLMVLELDRHATMSVRYCLEKTSDIQNAARTMSRTLGREGKYDYCKQDLAAAFTRLQDFHTKHEVSDEEFAELGSDMVRLGRVNVSACGLLDRERIETAISVIQKVLPLAAGL